MAKYDWNSSYIDVTHVTHFFIDGRTIFDSKTRNWRKQTVHAYIYYYNIIETTKDEI